MGQKSGILSIQSPQAVQQGNHADGHRLARTTVLFLKIQFPANKKPVVLVVTMESVFFSPKCKESFSFFLQNECAFAQ